MKGNLLDRAIAAVSPAWGAQRIRSRMFLAAASGYEAAKRERAALRNFNPRGQTADQDVLPGLSEQRARSRAMLMNAPIAAGAVNTVVTNVVGTGLRCSAQADRVALKAGAGLDDAAVTAFEQAAEREWRLFSRRENFDARGRLRATDAQELSFRSTLENGDCFAALVAARDGGPFDFTVQLIEADRVSNPNHKSDSETLAGGIENDAAGIPIRAHVAEIPRTGTGARKWRALEFRAPDGAPRLLHLMHQRRIDQSRGVPYLAPVIATLKELDRYTEAELTAAVLNASIAIMGESETGDSPLKNEAEAAGTGAPSGTPGLRRADIQFEPGMVLEGFMPGETIKSFSPDRPSGGFDPFVLAILRQVGVALELPFELLVKHFTASYSAARAALLQAWGFFLMRRSWLAGAFCQPIYEQVLANAVMRGRLVAPGFLTDPVLRAAYCGARWTGPSAGQLDPLKEVNAAEKRLALMISTRTRETAELTGEDWEDVIAEWRTEEALMQGLTSAPASAGDAAEPPARERPDGTDLEDEDELEREDAA